MKQTVKALLSIAGRLPGFRRLWLGMARWLLGNFALPVRFRDVIMWEISTYLLGENFETEVRLRTGPVMAAGMSDELNRLVLFCPNWRDYIWEPQTLKLALYLQPKAGTTIIAGAHIGYHALHLAQAAKAQAGRVIAFEPVESFYKSLIRGQQLSGFNNLVCERGLLSRQSQSKTVIHVAGMRSSVAESMASKTGVSETVPAFSLDDYTKTHNVSDVKMIFLDVEGSELEVLVGASTLVSNKPDLILEVNRPGLHGLGLTPDHLYEFLFAHGYSLLFIEDDYFFTLGGYDPSNVVLRPILSEDKHFHPEMRAFNILAIKDLERLNESGITVSVDQPIGVAKEL